MSAFLQVFAFDVAAKVMLAVAAVVLIRYAPQQEYALYTFVLSVSTLLSQVVSSTFNRIYIIGHDRFRGRCALPTFLWLQIWCVLALGAVILPLAVGIGTAYLAAVALAVAVCLTEYCKTAMQQEQRFLAYSFAEIARAGISAASILLLLVIYGERVRASDVLLVQGAALGMLFVALYPRRISFRAALQVGTASRLAAAIARGPYRWLLGYFVLLALFGQVEILMLMVLGEETDLASYGAAFRYYSLVSLALAAVHAVLLPKIAQLRGAQELVQINAQHRRLALSFIPIVALLAWVSQWLLPWIDLGKYPSSVDVFRVLCVSALLSFAFSPHVNVVMRYERFGFLFRLILAALALSVLLNGLLIPVAGAIGAAWATLVASACVTIPIYLVSRRLVAASELPR